MSTKRTNRGDKAEGIPSFVWRRNAVLALFAVSAGVLAWRAVDLQIYERDFLRREGDVRHLRTVTIPAHRGMISDRNGEALAVSAPVQSIWLNPQKVEADAATLMRLDRAIGLKPGASAKAVKGGEGREFVYLRRHVSPVEAEKALDLGVEGVYAQNEYRRFYPAAEVTAHVVGFTNIDDHGQEGMELAYDEWLRGTSGAKRVIKDRIGRIIEDVELINDARPGQQLFLSIDRRIQYLAHRELKAAVEQNNAKAGSLVTLDVESGEVLAMVNWPAYNPNSRSARKGFKFRNRSVTDIFEPGSTMKPFTIACALEAGDIRPDTLIDTAPGSLVVAGHTITDHGNLGTIDVATVLKKSSNVGASKIALAETPRCLWSVFRRVGFGAVPGSGFPGEAEGRLPHYQTWRPIQQATLAYGYGLSVSALQLAEAYAVLAADGRRLPLSFTRVDEKPRGERVLPRSVALQVRHMLEGVTTAGGTATRAQVPGYRVAGKTGTAHKPVAGGYSEDNYLAIFAGMAPVSRPRLVTVVVVDDPKGGAYFGGLVAAPIFARVMAGALRLLDVPPDALPDNLNEVRQAAVPLTAGGA